MHILFVTGKLAEPGLRRVLADLGPRAGFQYSLAVLPITVAALATTPWIARHLQIPPGVDRVILPGLCLGDIQVLNDVWGNIQVERGPKDYRDLPDFFSAAAPRAAYGAHDIAILAEINHAPRMSRQVILEKARKAHADGADIIDLGCDPGDPWSGLEDAVQALRAEGFHVSVDTFHPQEAAAGAKAGAELILSVNGSNRAAAPDWGCEVVVLPDEPANLSGLDATIEFLEARRVPYRVDPVLEPIGFGFAASLGRYLEVRRRYPQAEMMMGVGNLTELTDVDSAGINVLLAGFCQEVGIRSVLTTEVINWCRSGVRELDLARRLVHHACTQHVLPKRVEPNLVLLRDPKVRVHGEKGLRELAAQIKDKNFRLFAERGLLHVIYAAAHLSGTDPFALFAEMQGTGAIDAAHAFYLGYEMAKAVTALTLGKNYVQDQALRWGFLTVEESGDHHHPGEG
jgi:dihydropteroate synthase-like protein